MKAVALVSGGIGSQVAAYLMMKKGVEVVGVFMGNGGRKEGEKVVRLMGHLKGLGKQKVKNLYIVPHGGNLKELSGLNEKLTCVFCKRMMLRVANRIGEKEGATFIIMGDNLAQAASQTLGNMAVIDEVSGLPVLRPLIGLDEQETIGIAKDIGTYDISIKDAAKCAFVPDQPAPNVGLDLVEHFEEKLNIGGLVMDCVDDAKVVELKSSAR